MPLSEWKHLGMIADRIGQLHHQAQAAAAVGDLAMAAYFKRQAWRAEQDRQHTVDRLFGDVCANV
jgi:hypothetical protein